MKTVKTLNLIGNILIVISLLGLFLTFGPGVKQEINYEVKKISGQKKDTEVKLQELKKTLEPVNTDFSILIPKINAAAPIVVDVDPFNEKEFLRVLKKGVAHAKNTSLPGSIGNIYLFAHSTDAFYNVGNYNAVFYLIGKLNTGDRVYIYYKSTRFEYQVYDKKVVAPEAIEYLNILEKGGRTLTLQTCYPPGTTLRRMVVLARQII